MGPQDHATVRGFQRGPLARRSFFRASLAIRSSGEKLAAAMAALHQPAEVLDRDAQMPAADRARFVKIRNSRHDR
jgi:hypothetical protein